MTGQAGKFGAPVPGWTPPPAPDALEVLDGRHVRLERLDADAHAADLHRAMGVDDGLWDYMPYGPFGSAARYHRWIKDSTQGRDPRFFALRDRAGGHCGGVAAFLRIAPEAGSIEVGHICLAPEMQRTPAATEAIYLMMGWAFSQGYRRFEWKCDARNLPSRRAAERLGLSFEGVFRQAGVVKGRNRDTAWFAAIDSEWSALQAAFEAWLDPRNFTSEGRQRERLSDLTRLVRVASDPALTAGG